MRSRRGIVRWKLEEIRRQGGKCPLCGKPYSKERPPTVDHIIPLSMGGGNSKNNRRVICRDCNNRKGGKPVWNPAVKCHRCKDTHIVLVPLATHPHLVREWPCPDCRAIVPKALLATADALASAGGVPESVWKKLHAAYRAAREGAS